MGLVVNIAEQKSVATGFKKILVFAVLLVSVLFAIVVGSVAFKWFGVGQDSLAIGACVQTNGKPFFQRMSFPATFQMTDGSVISVESIVSKPGMREVVITNGSQRFELPTQFSDYKWVILMFEDDKIWIRSGDVGKIVVHKLNGEWKETWYKRAKYELGFDEPVCIAD